jgi:hypothetical protein
MFVQNSCLFSSRYSTVCCIGSIPPSLFPHFSPNSLSPLRTYTGRSKTAIKIRYFFADCNFRSLIFFFTLKSNYTIDQDCSQSLFFIIKYFPNSFNRHSYVIHVMTDDFIILRFHCSINFLHVVLHYMENVSIRFVVKLICDLILALINS